MLGARHIHESLPARRRISKQSKADTTSDWGSGMYQYWGGGGGFSRLLVHNESTKHDLHQTSIHKKKRILVRTPANTDCAVLVSTTNTCLMSPRNVAVHNGRPKPHAWMDRQSTEGQWVERPVGRTDRSIEQLQHRNINSYGGDKTLCKFDQHPDNDDQKLAKRA